MPEGDTIYRTACQLRHAIEGQIIKSVAGRHAGPRRDDLLQAVVMAVEARGKHLLLHLDKRLVIHSHLGMTGSWHLYRHGQPWRKSAGLAELVLNFADQAAVCFSPKTFEILTIDGLRRHPHISRLGPDLLSSDFDYAAAVARCRQFNSAPVGEVIMNQTVTCGIGNVYKSEVLFLRRLDPFALVHWLTDQQLTELLQAARQLLRKNVGGAPRQTRFGRDGQRLWVYGRSGEPCLICGMRIGLRRQGDLGRSTYWCPQCQPGSEPRPRVVASAPDS